MKDEVARLKEELRVARETNRRLNRRCQQFEHELAVAIKEPAKLINLLRMEAGRVHMYANELRDLYRKENRSVHSYYEKEWKRLPRGRSHFDGIKYRVDEALRLIERTPLEKFFEDVAVIFKRD